MAIAVLAKYRVCMACQGPRFWDIGKCLMCKLPLCEHLAIKHDGCDGWICRMCAEDKDHIPQCDMKNGLLRAFA